MNKLPHECYDKHVIQWLQAEGIDVNWHPSLRVLIDAKRDNYDMKGVFGGIKHVIEQVRIHGSAVENPNYWRSSEVPGEPEHGRDSWGREIT